MGIHALHVVYLVCKPSLKSNELDSSERDHLLENDREWRRYLVEKIETLIIDHANTSDRLSRVEVWNHVFRIVGAGIFALLLVWVELRLK